MMPPLSPGPLHDFLIGEGYSDLRIRPDGTITGVERFMFTTAIVVGIDWHGREGRYCYATPAEARKALAEWDGTGDPPGAWIIYKGWHGERIGPGGDDRYPIRD